MKASTRTLKMTTNLQTFGEMARWTQSGGKSGCITTPATALAGMINDG